MINNYNSAGFYSQISKLQQDHIQQLTNIISKILVYYIGLENAKNQEFLTSCLSEVNSKQKEKIVQQHYLKLSNDFFYKDIFLLNEVFSCSITPENNELVVTPTGQFFISSEFKFLFPDLITNNHYEYQQTNFS